MQEDIRPFLAALATAGAVTSAHGITLGDLEVQSALGQRLEARVRVDAGPGERVDASCFGVLPEVPQGLSAVPGLEVALDARGTTLRLTSRAPVHEPAAGLSLRAGCPGTPSGSTREYVLLLDPLPPGASTIVRARRGETLASLARSLVEAPGPRREYLVAMRAANPSLAAVGEREALEEGTAVVLPDLRPSVRKGAAPSAARTPRETPGAAQAATAPKSAPAKPVAPNVAGPKESAPKAAEPKVAPPAAEPKAAPAARQPAAPRAGEPLAAPRRGGRDGFVLRLSTPEVDLSRSQQVTDDQRQQLRERLLVLDADDQVAALLAMRHSLKQLETRVAELQLKLAAMPESFPQRAASKVDGAPAAKAEAPVTKPEVPAPKAEIAAPKVDAPAKVESPLPPAQPPVAQAEPPKAEPPPAITPPVLAEAPKPEASEAPAQPPVTKSEERKPKVIARAPAATGFSIPEWAWIAAVLLVLLLGWLALRMRRRAVPVEGPPTEPRMGAGAEALASDAPFHEPPAARATEAPSRAELTSDAMLATRLTDNSAELRRRYIEERFPEVINGTIVLTDADSVIKGARLFYEDGAMPRAVELLQFAIDDRPAEVRLWLALFEIFRVERLAGEYGELAGRFMQLHGAHDAWRKVRYFGREIDPGNALYREDAVNTLETIGPREGRRLAAHVASVDPIAENWLNAPMDFENEVLANELRNVLMAQAQLTDQDLAPNPMPALRNVEMFTVA